MCMHPVAWSFVTNGSQQKPNVCASVSFCVVIKYVRIYQINYGTVDISAITFASGWFCYEEGNSSFRNVNKWLVSKHKLHFEEFVIIPGC